MALLASTLMLGTGSAGGGEMRGWQDVSCLLSFWGSEVVGEGLWELAAASRHGSHCLPWCAALGLAALLRAAATVRGGRMAGRYRLSIACLGRAGGVVAAWGQARVGMWGVPSCRTRS